MFQKISCCPWKQFKIPVKKLIATTLEKSDDIDQPISLLWQLFTEKYGEEKPVHNW